MRKDARVGGRMIGRETIVEEGRCGNKKRVSEKLKGSKRKQR